MSLSNLKMAREIDGKEIMRTLKCTKSDDGEFENYVIAIFQET